MKRTERQGTLARLLDHAHRTAGVSKRALARRAGIAPETLSRIARRGTADFATVVKIAKAAGLSLGAEGLPMSVVGGHDRLDQRSLVMHALCAGKILADPSLLSRRVLPTIKRFKGIHADTGALGLLETWERAARAGPAELMRLCVDPSERGKQLRQASPLTGLITQQERRGIHEAFAA